MPSSIHTSVIMNNSPKSRTLKESDDHREMEGKPRFLVNVEDKKSRDQHIINSDLIRSSKGSIPSLVSKKEKSEQINCKVIR